MGGAIRRSHIIPPNHRACSRVFLQALSTRPFSDAALDSERLESLTWKGGGLRPGSGPSLRPRGLCDSLPLSSQPAPMPHRYAPMGNEDFGEGLPQARSASPAQPRHAGPLRLWELPLEQGGRRQRQKHPGLTAAELSFLSPVPKKMLVAGGTLLPSESGEWGFQQGPREQRRPQSLAEFPLSWGSGVGPGPGRRLPDWEEGTGRRRRGSVPSWGAAGKPFSCPSISFVLHEARCFLGSLETVEGEARHSPERPLQRLFWTHQGKRGAQPAEGALERPSPGKPFPDTPLLPEEEPVSPSPCHSLKASGTAQHLAL